MPKHSFLEKWRAEIVVIVVLPVSLVLWLFKTFEQWFSAPSPDQHSERVQTVAVFARKNAGKLVRTSDKSNIHQAPLRNLRAILGLQHIISKASKIVHVEPGATVGEVSNYLLKQNLQLECCLGREDATLGRLAMAQGIATHSHICGLLFETVVEYEIVTGDGTILTVTEDNEHRSLFRALPFSHGSLGLLVSLKLRVVPAKPFVRLTYQPLTSTESLQSEYTAILDRVMSDRPFVPFFVEAIAYSNSTSVLMTGELVNRASPLLSNRIGLWYKPWFFKHVEFILHNNKTVVEDIPIRDYLMRHNRSMSMTMATIIPYGNHPLFRLFLGWLLPPQMNFLKSSHTAATRETSIRKQCFQDVAFPAVKFQDALALTDKLFNIYPLLVYPCKVINRGGMIRVSGKEEDTQMNLNLGIYGVPPEFENDTFELFPMIGRVRLLEKWLRENGGFQYTYCDSFQTEEEFHEMFDHTLYNEMRKKYNAEGSFRSVYDKTRPEVDTVKWLKEEEESNEKRIEPINYDNTVDDLKLSEVTLLLPPAVP